MKDWSVDWVELGSTDQELAPLLEIARSIDVFGIPNDVLRIVHHHGPMPLRTLLRRSYLPNALTLAFVLRGLQEGVLRRSGGLIELGCDWSPLVLSQESVCADDFFEFLRPRLKLHFYQGVDVHLVSDFLETINRRQDVKEHTRCLCVGDGEAAALRLKEAGVRDVWALDIDEDVVDFYAGRGVRAVKGDTRFIRDFCLGVFDLITSYQIESFQDEAIASLVWANLAPYGVYYTYFVGHENERDEWISFVSRIEEKFVITDVLERDGSYLLRCVKYPEFGFSPT